MVLQKRCQWRDIQANIIPVTLETSLTSLQEADMIFMGGAQDRQQKLAGEDFLTKKGPVVKQMVDDGVPALFVCAAYQFVGHFYKPYQGEKIEGAGIFDLYTEHPGNHAKRLIGNTVATIVNPPELAGQTMVGFENHGGYTTLGQQLSPLARTHRGGGNNGKDGFEGAVYKNSIGSYFHGPLFPKNPHIADWLIAKALEKKYNKAIVLPALDDTMEKSAQEMIMKREGV
jgi:CobQ-like glutamine amidotransferase family enzyme